MSHYTPEELEHLRGLSQPILLAMVSAMKTAPSQGAASAVAAALALPPAPAVATTTMVTRRSSGASSAKRTSWMSSGGTPAAPDHKAENPENSAPAAPQFKRKRSSTTRCGLEPAAWVPSGAPGRRGGPMGAALGRARVCLYP